ncbi:MAG: DUF1993 domain-containing protein [Tatlockia sp.]|nr:DUF1993 domain-containing protein [Tatlockia sp.]
MTEAISMYYASVPVFKQLLTALNANLDKAEAYVASRNLAPESLLQASLFSDMFNFTRQVQIAADFAKGVTARLAGLDVPAYEDSEMSFSELKARIVKTLLFLSEINAEAINGSEEKEIILRPGTPKEKKMTGQAYLLHYGLPQFFFHVTTAYDILRNQGVEIGKRDFMGTY